MRPRATATLPTSTVVTTNPDAVPAVREHLAPRGDDEGVAVGGAPARHRPCCAWRDHHRPVLDGPGPVQHVPVRLARHLGEGGGYGEDLRAGLGEGAVELGETQVVADGHAEPAPGRVHHDGMLAGRDDGGFAVLLGGREVHVEQEDFVVAGSNAALVVDDVAAVDEPVAGSVHRDGADQRPHPGIACEAA